MARGGNSAVAARSNTAGRGQTEPGWSTDRQGAVVCTLIERRFIEESQRRMATLA
jgi:hypothetical protein